MRLGWFLPFKNIYLVDEQKVYHYRFRFGRLYTKKSFSSSSVSLKKGTILFDSVGQDFHNGSAPKLKFFDRKPFIYHTLQERFKTINWLGYRWISSSHSDHKYLAVKVETCSLSSSESTLKYGCLGAELKRLDSFKEAEVLIIAPSQGGKIREIYLRNGLPHYLRLVDQQGVKWEEEIEALKRYLERHFQVNTHALKILWWGSSLPRLFQVILL
jgi:hypothetical protein